MIEFLGSTFLSLHSLLQDQYYVVKTLVRSGEATAPLTTDEKKYIHHLVTSFGVECRALGFEASALQASMVEAYVSVPGPPTNHFQLQAGLESLITHAVSELSRQRFAFIPTDRHKYFEQDNLFKLNMPTSQFPSADRDIRDAGNAYAVGLHTAAVFHVMRVAEIGLRVFAKHLKVKLPKKRGPIEWAQWEDVLKEISTKIDLLALKPGTRPKKSADRAFYRGVLAEFQGFKDMYRNDVMHARRTYDQYEAASALERVGEFMQRLGTRIHE